MVEIRVPDTVMDVDFAILDLAIDPELLAWLYGQMTQHELCWQSLYRGTAWQDRWQTGPILVELRGNEAAIAEFADRLVCQPIGIFLAGKAQSLDDARTHFSELSLVDMSGSLAAFRFYDPRHFSELLNVLTNGQRQALIPSGVRCLWHDSEQWRECAEPGARDKDSSAMPVSLSADQLEKLENLKRLKKARSLASHYQHWIEDREPVAAVFNHMTSARDAGLERVADQERWLRVALKLKAPVESSSEWLSLAANDQLTPRQRLKAIENTV